MIPPVPYLVRLTLSTVIMALAVSLGFLANWITPEIMADEPAGEREPKP